MELHRLVAVETQELHGSAFYHSLARRGPEARSQRGVVLA
jgi:hypothetical protein